MNEFEPLPKETEELLEKLIEQAGKDVLSVLIYDYTPEIQELNDLGYLNNFDLDYSLSCSFQLSNNAFLYERNKKKYNREKIAEAASTLGGAVGKAAEVLIKPKL